METIKIKIDPANIADYEKFMKCKLLPNYEVKGHEVITTKASYDFIFGKKGTDKLSVNNSIAFDYQQAVVNTALERKGYAAFLDCGLGKTLILLMWMQEVAKTGKVLLLCPMQVMNEFFRDAEKFGIKTKMTNLRDTNLQWSEGIGVLNYEYAREVDMRGVSGIALDESSILKNGNGSIKDWVCNLSSNIEYRIACSATPAPNEQSEYASHAVFLGVYKTEKEFYSRYFRKDGTDWILKPHAVEPFYNNLSSFCCYIQDPEKLGFENGGHLKEEPEIIPFNVGGGQEFLQYKIVADSTGLAEALPIYRYRQRVEEERFLKSCELAESAKSIVWCMRNEEEAAFAKNIKNSVLITGQTPIEERVALLDAWRFGEINCIISKPKILGWGVNMQQADIMVYSGYDFSFEKIYQAIRRAHRNGRVGRLKVYFPMIAAECSIFDVFIEKQKTFQSDVYELQRLFGLKK